MKIKLLLTIGILIGVTLAYARADGTAFTYLGLLDEAGNPANGTYDFQFGLYDAATNGNLVAGFETNSAVPVSNGLFTTTLDFGNVFSGTPYWLNLAVRSNGSGGAFVSLQPRQPILPAPMALYSFTAGTASNANSVFATNIVGLSASQLTNGIVPLSVLPAAVVTNNFTGTLNGSNAMQVVYLPNQTIYTNDLIIGNGGQNMNVNGVQNTDPANNSSIGSWPSEFNTFVGIGAGTAVTTGNEDTFVGTWAGQHNSNGTQNTFIGDWAGNSTTSGYHNTAVGSWAGNLNTTGIFNVWVGTDCGLYCGPNGSGNVFVGTGSGASNNGNCNVAIGTSAFADNVTGSNNVVLGNLCGEGNISGEGNVFLGASACEANTTGNYSVALGYNSFLANTTGGGNTALGSYSLRANVSSSASVALGYFSLPYSLGANNIAVGAYSGINVTNGTNNIQILDNWSSAQTGVDENNVTRIGNGQTVAYIAGVVTASNGFSGGTKGQFTVGPDGTVTSSNIVGNGAGLTNVQPGGLSSFPPNTVLGNATGSAGAPTATGNPSVSNLTFSGTVYGSNGFQFLYLPNQTIYTNNLVIGNGGRLLNTSGTVPVDPDPIFPAEDCQANTFVGTWAGQSNITGAQNTFIGSQAGQANVNGTQNIFVGQQAGQNNTSGYHNVYIGEDAGANMTTGYYNVMLGTDAGLWATAGSQNVIIGIATGQSNAASGNVFVGSQSGNYNTTGSNNNFIGLFAGAQNTTGSGNVFIGEAAGDYNSTGSLNIAIGNGALQVNTTGQSNTAVGASALNRNTTGVNNTANGYESLYGSTTGSGNTAVGAFSMVAANTGSDNTAVGVSALSKNTSGAVNTGVGYNALTAVTSGGHNVAVGAYALEGVKLANGNTGVGYDVAPFCVGTNNTFIGQYSGINVTNGSNNIQILNNFVSNQIGVDESNVTRIGNGQTVAYIAGVVTASNGFAAYNTYDLPAFTATGYTNTNAFIVTAALPNGGTNIIKSNSVPALIYGPVNSPGLCEITLGPGCTMTSGSALIKINAFGQ